ncbi:MAG: hypothetical protein HKL86_05425 [Acidimicrobiaceae bacterium]|nr:hypothetical protein [Acidimicrobiaceae bacterium]
MQRFRRIFSALVAPVVMSGVAPLVTTAPAAYGATPSVCSSKQVTLSAKVDQVADTRGALMHVTVALHNHSAQACSYATGPFSPSFTLSNAAGVTVWGSCWFGGGPAPCAYYLRQNVLAPGATYRDRLAWDQRSGHPDRLVSAGRYLFKASFPGLSLNANTTIVLGRSRNVTVNLSDSGHHYVLFGGALLTVHLLGTGLVWTDVVSSNPRVLVALPELNPVGEIFVFRARAPGSARVSAVGNPSCYPQCLMASRLFFVTVSVRAP